MLLLLSQGDGSMCCMSAIVYKEREVNYITSVCRKLRRFAFDAASPRQPRQREEEGRS